MAYLVIEDSIYEEFIKQYTDPITQKQVASVEIAKLLGRSSKNKSKHVCTTIGLDPKQQEHVNEVMSKTKATRKEYLSELIMNCDQNALFKYFGPPTTYKRNIRQSQTNNRVVSFTPDLPVYNKWKELADSVYVSLQMVIDFLLMLQINQGRVPEQNFSA